jgi:GTP-binding protein
MMMMCPMFQRRKSRKSIPSISRKGKDDTTSRLLVNNLIVLIITCIVVQYLSPAGNQFCGITTTLAYSTNKLSSHPRRRKHQFLQSNIDNFASSVSSSSMLYMTSDPGSSSSKGSADVALSTSATNESNVKKNPAATPISSSSTSTNEYSFFDEATIYVRAGSGGQGASTYKKGVNNQNGPADGGNGGRGGDVILQLDESLNTLAGLARYAWRPNSFGGGGGAKRRRVSNSGSSGSSSSGGGSGTGESSTRVLSFRAENGIDGGRQCKQGRNGKDVVVRVPPGTIVQEEIITTNSNSNNNFAKQQQQQDDGNDEDDRHYIDCGTITHINPTQIIATGGQGGEGSAAKTLQRGVRRPRSPPQGGQRKRLKLTLKVVADVALVALPNAGKSTLLSKVTRAKPKIADYPFTTVVPNLGVWVPSDFDAYVDDEEEDGFSLDEQGNPIPSSNSKSLILCDVPGLIAGASEGVGLGHAFLRHVERCHVILHLLDASSKSVLDDYAMINRELLNYGTGKLATMPQVVVVNKVDVEDFDKAQLEDRLKDVMPHSRLMWISAKEGEGVDDLMSRVAMFVKKVKEATAAEEEKKKVEKLEQSNESGN